MRQRIGGEVGAGTGRRGDAHRHEQREYDLAEIVGFARIGAHDVAQRPLQEQQHNERQRQPLGGADDMADYPIKPL